MSLIRICSKGVLPEVKSAVAAGADINETDATGRTPLLEAAWNGDSDIVKYLLDCGADPNRADKSGFTPLMRAAEGGHLPAVNALVNKGADVNCRGHVRGTTPLMLAAENGHTRIITVLLNGGAKVNAVDQYEETALAKARRTGQEKAAQMLEAKGGRGKMERSNYPTSDRELKELRHVTRASRPQWNFGGASDADDDDI